jgi:hypothetical protein
MFRTVEWCDIGGFDAWWERKARELSDELMGGGISNQIIAGAAIFNFCRSQLGIRLLNDELALMLRAIAKPQTSIRSFNVDPWIEVCVPANEEGRRHVQHAANILFAARQLNREDLVSNCAGRALELLIASQIESAPWPNIENEPSSFVTATVIHSLALWEPTGWKRSARRAVEWLWQQQSEFGNCHDPIAPDDTYMTVFALDAIDIAEDKSQLTFMPRRAGESSDTGSTATDSGVLVTTLEIPALGDRQYLILQALLMLDATSADQRVSTAEVATKAEGSSANPANFKEPIAGLKTKQLIDSREGRGGGVWLTSSGKRIAEKLCAQFPDSLATDSGNCKQ